MATRKKASTVKSTAKIEPVDVLACADICQQLTAEAEAGMSAELAIPRLEAIEALEAQLKAAKAELTTQALRGLERQKVIGNAVYRRKPKVKMRPDQSRIAGLVRGLVAAPDDKGELPPVLDAVDRAIGVMSALYVSPSLVPKAGGMKMLGRYVDDVCTEESNGFEIEKVEIPT